MHARVTASYLISMSKRASERIALSQKCELDSFPNYLDCLRVSDRSLTFRPSAAAWLVVTSK